MHQVIKLPITKKVKNNRIKHQNGSELSFFYQPSCKFILFTGLIVDYGLTDMKKETGQAFVSYHAPLASGTKANSILVTSNAKK
jgi:hypothetical protein